MIVAIFTTISCFSERGLISKEGIKGDIRNIEHIRIKTKTLQNNAILEGKNTMDATGIIIYHMKGASWPILQKYMELGYKARVMNEKYKGSNGLIDS